MNAEPTVCGDLIMMEVSHDNIMEAQCGEVVTPDGQHPEWHRAVATFNAQTNGDVPDKIVQITTCWKDDKHD